MTKIAWRFRHTEYNCLVRVFKSWCLALMSVYSVEGWRGGAIVGRRTCDQEVASSGAAA